MARIKDGRLRYVVTTELAARGIDIPDLSHVINFELPTDAPHYVHRYCMFDFSITVMVYWISCAILIITRFFTCEILGRAGAGARGARVS